MLTFGKWDEEISLAFEQAVSFIEKDADGRAFVKDPNDGARVLGHYGETHLCAALLIRARRKNEPKLRDVALDLLQGVLARWDEDARSPESHANFNNFATAIACEELEAQGEKEWAKKLEERLLTAVDSRNRTVNWLPMRAYVDLFRYEREGKDARLQRAIDALNVVKSAQYADGMFDDLLPKGKSFNLQYCVSTAALVRLIAIRFEKYADRLPKIDLTQTARVFYGLTAPDGDVNYMGRGCNQIFAWGPWLYFAENFVDEEGQARAFQFLLERFPTARQGRNLFLNSYPGEERALWWDYHHYSVYLAHLLLWNELASDVARVKLQKVDRDLPNDSGLRVYQEKGAFAVAFEGREHYLIEEGPALVALATQKHGAIFKCGHAPAGKMFSNKNFNPLTAYASHFGLIELIERPKRIKNKYVRKIFEKIASRERLLTLKPLFEHWDFAEREGFLECRTRVATKGKNERCFVFPSFVELSRDDVRVFAEDKEVSWREVGRLPSQYGDIRLYMSDVSTAQNWRWLIKER